MYSAFVSTLLNGVKAVSIDHIRILSIGLELACNGG